ncbi:hypothetical protein LAZ67_17001872 [Cordylochernes scorpioides]|uniref:Reverse transcriptase Ty1/copia-type domain-containing protein n=1 Tax=Cordylochernes scorpioides TaxID=51811 RepID=A0ABY6LDY1_9ARAC|nr:hypothetical protein LAZ67_17001872 [Cordylochernes scorpioides]
MDNLLVELAQEFEIRISNNPEMFVGMNIMNKDEGLILSQHDYIECVLKKYNMLDAKPVTTPIVGAVKIDPILENKSEGNFPYREAVGSLLYLANKTRPDVAYAVGYESRSMHEPTNQDIQNVKRTMRYLKQTKTFGLHYSKQDEDMELNAYCDSDFAGDMKTRKSTSGYTILFGKGPISWSSRKQPIVALSTTEAEYIAAAECVKELIYIKALIEELTNETILAKLNIDNQSAMTLMKTGQMNRKTKHIDVRYHFLKDQIRENVAVQFCPTQDQVADILTKPLPKETFEKHRSSLLKISGSSVILYVVIHGCPCLRSRNAWTLTCWGRVFYTELSRSKGQSFVEEWGRLAGFVGRRTVEVEGFLQMLEVEVPLQLAGVGGEDLLAGATDERHKSVFFRLAETGLSVYLGIMRCLREAVRLKRPEGWQNNDWILHVGNARPHTAHVVLQFLAKHSTIQIPHPPYSPDLAPNDFFLYPKLKMNLKGRKFDNVDMIQAESKATLRNLSKSDFISCFDNWKKRWNGCIEAGGAYFEKY